MISVYILTIVCALAVMLITLWEKQADKWKRLYLDQVDILSKERQSNLRVLTEYITIKSDLTALLHRKAGHQHLLEDLAEVTALEMVYQQAYANGSLEDMKVASQAFADRSLQYIEKMEALYTEPTSEETV